MPACTTIQRLRKPKILNMSIFDWITSLLLAALLGYFLSIKGSQWLPFLLAWTLFGVLTHYAFDINTMLGYYLGINPVPIRQECN